MIGTNGKGALEEDIGKLATEALTEIRRPFGAPPVPGGILQIREVTHGSFEDNARMSQSLKLLMRASPGWIRLCDVEREAMDMIAVKFSRILSGKSLEKQHWEDVVGYGQLVEKICV